MELYTNRQIHTDTNANTNRYTDINKAGNNKHAHTRKRISVNTYTDIQTHIYK